MRPQPPRPETHGLSGLRLALGYNRGRILTNWSFADGVLADGVLANWGVLDDRLRMREVRSNGSSNKSQTCSPSDYEFQHRSLLLSSMDAKVTRCSLRANKQCLKPTIVQSFFDERCKNGTELGDWELASVNELLQGTLR